MQIINAENQSILIELRFYVPLDTNQVISDIFFPRKRLAGNCIPKMTNFLSSGTLNLHSVKRSQPIPRLSTEKSEAYEEVTDLMVCILPGRGVVRRGKAQKSGVVCFLAVCCSRTGLSPSTLTPSRADTASIATRRFPRLSCRPLASSGRR